MTWLWEELSGGTGWLFRVLVRKMSGLNFVTSIGFFFVVAVIDRFAGRRILSWTRGTLRSFGGSVGIHLTNLVILPILLFWAGNLQTVYDWLHIPHLPSSVWAGMPIWLVAIVGIVAHDFANYWNHRAMHRRWIWPIHAIHHSDPEVTAVTTLRIHPFEGIFMGASYVLLLSWLGIPKVAIGIVGVVIMLHNEYVHVNVDWTHGPLRWIIASPRFHRWHHIDDPAAHGKNLANICPFFDVLFGTYYDPGPCKGPLGARGVPENDVVKLVLFPFTEWARITNPVGRNMLVERLDVRARIRVSLRVAKSGRS